MKIIYKSFCPFPSNLGAFALGEVPTRDFDARLFAKAEENLHKKNSLSQL